MEIANEKLYTKEEIGVILQISQSTLNRYLHDKKIKYYKVGGLVRIPQSSLVEYLERNTHDIEITNED